MIRELNDTEVEAVVGGKHHGVVIKNSTVTQSNNESLDGATVSNSTITFGNQSNSIG